MTTGTISSPSISSSLGTLSSPGIGSGLDVNGIVSKLMAVESQPLTNLNNQQASYQSQISLLGQIESGLSGFQTAAQGLQTAAGANSYLANTGNAAILTGTTSSTATAGSYAINVTQLAVAQSIASPGQASSSTAIGTGTSTTLTIGLGTISGGSFSSSTGTYTGATFTANPNKTPVTVTIDSTNNTLAGIRDAINAANAGVTATIVNDGSATPYRLVITSNDTGAANSIQIGVSGDATINSLLAYDPSGTQNLTQLQTAQDAKLTVGGIPVTSASNAVTGAANGVTINLNGTGSTSLTVTRDTSSLSSALSQLVTSYNTVAHVISTATAKGALLQGDASTLQVQSQLRSALGALVQGTGNYSSLSSLGVTFQQDGTLAFDSTKFSAAVSADFTNVSALLTTFGNSLTTMSGALVDPTSGPINARTSGINRSIGDISSRVASLSQRLSATQANYLAQFNALDTLMSSMQQTSSYLTQQLANLPKITG